MTTTSELIKVNPQEYGLEEKDKESLTIGLKSVLEAREILLAEFDEVSKLEITKENLPKFRELRLKFQRNRTQGINEWHKKAKEVSLRTGQLLDAIKKNEIFINEQKEEFLENGEKHFENLEKERIENLNTLRIGLISEYVSDTTGLNFGTMQDEVWDAYYNAKRKEHEEMIIAEQKAEQEREAKRIEEERIETLHKSRTREAMVFFSFWTEHEKSLNLGTISQESYNSFLERITNAKQEHDAKIEAQRIENERLKSEAEAKEKELEAERAKAKADADRIKAENQAKLKAEREAREKEESEKLVRFEQRKNRLIEMGFEYFPQNEYNFILKGIWSCFWEQVYNPTDKEFESFVDGINEAIKRNFEKTKLEAELQAKKDAEIKAENERKDAEAKAQKEAAKLAKAPIKKQLVLWMDTFNYGLQPTENETTKQIIEKFESFKNWAKQEIEKI